MNIYLDIDDVIFDWHKDYAKYFGVTQPTEWDTSEAMKNRLEILSKNRIFWLNLTLKNKPDFTPKGYVTARSIPKAWTTESLQRNFIPGRSSVHQVPWGVSKIEKLQELKCDIFIDDKIETFVECLNNDIFCLLMDAPHNQHINTEHRIYDLKHNNIMYLWQRLK